MKICFFNLFYISLQKEEYTTFNEDDGIKPLMESIHWMGNKIHFLIEENNNLKNNYSKSEYINNHTKICIICPKHGEFWQTPNNHLNGKGCPKCNESKLEKNVRNVLEREKIEYIYQKHFSWLGLQSLDFYLPKYNIAIECQGEQHYKPVDFAGNGNGWAKKLFEENIKRDKIKLDKVLKHNIKMIYVNEENKDNFLNEIL